MNLFLFPEEMCSWVVCCGPSRFSLDVLSPGVQNAVTALLLGKGTHSIDGKGIECKTERFCLKLCSFEKDVIGIRISEGEKHLFMGVFKV